MSTWNSDQDSFNKGGLIAFVFSMVFTIGFFIYISFVHRGVDLKEIKAEPQSTEAAPAGAPATAPATGGQPGAQNDAPNAPQRIADVSSVKEPWVETPALIEHGHAVYLTACVGCHGEEGKGNGPMAARLPTPPRDIVEGKWRFGGSPLELYQTITHGLETGMASFSYMPSAERWAVVHFVRSITRNKVAFNPTELAAKAATLN